jgi:RHS repeat-associated protein
MNGVTRQGYTFQTVLGSMGLNHMNGRIEDSITGRFLSPDPDGTIRGDTQSWNRYSYVNNNPLTMSDPSGFCGTNTQEGEIGDCSDGAGGGFSPTTPFSVPPLEGELQVLGHTCGNGFSACTSYSPPDAWQPTPSVTIGAGSIPEIVVTAASKKPKPQISPIDIPPIIVPLPDVQQPGPLIFQPPCYNGSNPNRQRNIVNGALIGFSVFAAAGAFVVINIVGFPEAEIVEFGAAGSLTASGSYTLASTILAGEPLGTAAVGAITGGMYGTVVGGGFGAALPVPGC